MKAGISFNHHTLAPLPSRAEMEQAFYAKDSSYDGVFFVAVRTTGIFCRPSCPARPKRQNIEFFATLQEAINAGYRPCKRCRPADVYGAVPEWVATLMHRVDTMPTTKVTTADLRALGISPERARRWFREHYGMTFTAWDRKRRLAEAFTHLRDGAPIDDAVFAHGYESHSGFRDAFSKTFGVPPGQNHTSDYIAMQLIETPLGPLLVGAVRDGICLVEYTDRRMLEHNYAMLRHRFGLPVLPDTHSHVEQFRVELAQYFAGTPSPFTVPIVVRGTPFQEQVWNALQSIPHGHTISYDELARQIEQPRAVRAVAHANGMNYINILIPCHRVVSKDGQLAGYGGGVWRKRLLLELERTGTLPGTEAV